MQPPAQNTALDPASCPSQPPRPSVDGKFLRVEGHRFLVKGVTYGTFAPAPDGSQFPATHQVAADFAAMAQAGINTVRVYTPPRPDVLDAALAAGLRLIVGIPWTQHVAFLDDIRLTREIRTTVTNVVRTMAGHPALLLFALGNEIPPAVVRWHGATRVERFLRDLLRDARDVAPDALFTYVNYPPTEFLDLSAFDVAAFNVYLHDPRNLRAYLARLQHIAGSQPLLLAEAGADSLREGTDGQAQLLAMQLDAAFTEGCAGAIAFAWTDEWWRGGQDVRDWAFGLVDAERRPKPALDAVRTTLASAPFPDAVRRQWPKVSVVVCAYNAADTIGECLASLEALTYPDFEVIVVNDGSRDGTGEIARGFPRARVVDVPNGGLSAARNVGLREATGHIVAYTDADVRVDPDWLTYLIQPFLTSDVVGSGGPNIVPADDPWMAQCVARAPGGPTHVLLDDRIAEHVPGCNMAFTRDALLAVGGFNPTYVRAGDDVDLCWRLQARGWRIGFAPAALVWHRHRSSVRAYWRQQAGYGEGEAWLLHDHPDKFAGRHVMWHGRIYSPLPFIRALTHTRINTGPWGLAAFPSVYHPAADPLAYLPHSVVWQVTSLVALVLGLAALLLGARESGALLMALGLVGAGTTLHRCARCAARTALPGARPGSEQRPSRLRLRATIAWLHLLQPWARLKGRLVGQLHPPQTQARPRAIASRPWPRVRELWLTMRLLSGARAEQRYWSERWHGPADVLTRLTTALRVARLSRRLDADDGWQQRRDLAVPLGEWAAVDVVALVEEHAQGRVLTRVRLSLRPTWLAVSVVLVALLAVLAATSPGVSTGWPIVTATALASAVTFLGLCIWRTAGVLVGVRAVVARTLRDMGALDLERGRPIVRFAPEVAWPRHAARTSLTALLVGGALLGTSTLLHDAREEVVSWQQATPASPSAAAPAPGEPRPPAVGLAIAPNGDVYLADAERDVIRRVSSAGHVTTVSVSAGGPMRQQGAALPPASRVLKPLSMLDRPGGVAVSQEGDLFIADAEKHQIYRVDRMTGATVVVAGAGRPGFDGDGGPAIEALLDAPSAIAVDRVGNLYIADSRNHRIRRVRRAGGIIETVAGGGSLPDASDVGDGRRATDASLAWPGDLALTPGGDLYIADTEHHRIRRVDAKTGIITTIAGDGTTSGGGDGGPATQASLVSPTGLAVVVRRAQTTVYVADSSGGRVRVVAPDGTISSLSVPAGTVIRHPSRLAYHPRGWLYVADPTAGLTALSLTGAESRAVSLDERRPARRSAPGM